MAQNPYNWADDLDGGIVPEPRTARPEPPMPTVPPTVPGPSGPGRGARAAGAAGAAAGGFAGGLGSSFIPPINVNLNGGGGNGNGNGNGGNAAAAGGGDRHQGDRLIYMVERIELRNDRDILALAKAINHLGRELHLILGMRAEEVNGVLSTYKGKWYFFGASSKIKARLVSAHLKVSAEAAKALGVGSLKMAHAFNRHFVVPEREAKQRRGTAPRPKRREFEIGEQ
ncbi:hypothetical protein OIE71_34780 (plasmid) [Streptomyces sp. NBC_01725]|uniref:hypothetical protein n=1 Tax=Streptomyces sp. NBC_01725 TaxID=2975923 RepID=UPI002E2BBC59|nr:hypothetical protein [Streptomyces sp. NBC_01725]